jgi:hypothetical protein
LVVAGAAGAAAILTHYTAVLVIGPFAVWLVMRDDTFDLRLRALAAAAMTAPLLALAPLAAEQLSRGHQDWTDQFGRLGVDNTLRLLGTPFDGRYGNFSDVGLQVGAAVVVIAVTILATGERLIGVHNRRMVAACALAPIGAVILTSAVVHPVALTRYSAVAAPFVLVAVGVVAVHVQRELAVVLVGATLALSAIGVVGAERDQGQYPDTRGAVSTVAAHWRDGDVVVGVNLFSFPAALAYYAERKLPPEGRRVYDYPSAAAAFDAPEIVRVTRRRARIWLLADPPLPRPELRYALEGRGYRARREWRFEGPRGVQVVLASRAGR